MKSKGIYHADLLLHVGLVWELGEGALHFKSVSFLHINFSDELPTDVQYSQSCLMSQFCKTQAETSPSALLLSLVKWHASKLHELR